MSILNINRWISKIFILILNEILHLSAVPGVEVDISIPKTCTLYSCIKYSDTTHNKEDNKMVLTRPVKLYNHFMNFKTLALAEQELSNQIESQGMGKVCFSPGYMASTYLGIFLWSSNDTTSNHSSFSLSKLEPIRASEQKTITSPSSWSLPKVKVWQSKNQSIKQTRSPSPNEFPQIIGLADKVCNE